MLGEATWAEEGVDCPGDILLVEAGSGDTPQCRRQGLGPEAERGGAPSPLGEKTLGCTL